MQDFIEQLRQKFRAGRSDLFRQISWKAPARELLQAHASLIDGLLEEIYAFSCEAAGRKTSPAESSGLAIVATGGYGRRELHPFSDVDIAFIPSEEDDPWVEAVVHTAFKVVMDVFLSLRDVHVGYSFRPATEAAAWDVPTKTSLLDIRFICGTRSLADELESNIRRLLSPLDIMLECGQPDRRNGNPHRALYAVEPNLKEGPGSLRDLHRARWILKLLRGPGTNELESGLCGRAGISARQIAEVEEAADWFWRSRTWLHLAAGRLSDTLIADYQDRIAGELNGCSSQEWLSTHFARSETLARFRQTAVRMLLRGPLTVSGATLENGVLRPAGDDSRSDVALILAAQRYSIPIGLDALEHLQESRVDSLRQTEPSKKEVWAFNGIFSERAGTAAALRTLADNGLMDRFIPGFSEIMRFAPPDPAHRYTVGEHSLRMIEHLERLRYGQDPSGARFTDLLGQCSHFDMLCLAALIHDAGKIVPGRDHCESGANLAKSVAARLELAPEKSELLETLVRQHLLLVRTSRLHDLKSVSVIQRVAERAPIAAMVWRPNPDAMIHAPDRELSSEQVWDNLAYFLQRTVPVAEEAGVKLAAHPDDAPIPSFMGVARILTSLEGLQRLIDTVPSPCNGLGFCQGTIATMANVDMIEAIHRFGRQKKIFFAHFRNPRGQVPVFDEVFPDEGDTDMLAAVRAYREVGFDGVIRVDHAPGIVGDNASADRAFAFQVGYFRGLVQAAEIMDGPMAIKGGH